MLKKIIRKEEEKINRNRPAAILCQKSKEGREQTIALYAKYAKNDDAPKRNRGVGRAEKRIENKKENEKSITSKRSLQGNSRNNSKNKSSNWKLILENMFRKTLEKRSQNQKRLTYPGWNCLTERRCETFWRKSRRRRKRRICREKEREEEVIGRVIIVRLFLWRVCVVLLFGRHFVFERKRRKWAKREVWTFLLKFYKW